ncbi:MAG: putative toxin-antitoxin system toxin component, PIN family [Bacteroidetes bacterium]|nr:putative toxin-antitoxin system toxin component, PIN family [Bacteroidota bacterium]
MQKLILDTNVLVSALIQKSFPYNIVNELFVEGKITLCISEKLMSEYYEVLRRPKFAKYFDFVAKAEILLSDIEEKAVMYSPQITLDLLTDKDDNMILELADVCLADYIVTGNTNDFTMQSYKKTQIVTPREFWLLC